MNSNTHTLSLTASRAKAFGFLSKIENLPKWATLFCKELKKLDDGRFKVVTPQGEIFFRVDSGSKDRRY